MGGFPMNWGEEDNTGKPESNKDVSTFNLICVENDTTGAYVAEDISSPPKYVGGYDLTGGNGKHNSFVMMFVRRPNWFHRTMTRFFLGWKWNDKK